MTDDVPRDAIAEASYALASQPRAATNIVINRDTLIAVVVLAQELARRAERDADWLRSELRKKRGKAARAEISDAREQGYRKGSNAAWCSVLRQCVQHLGLRGQSLEGLQVERQEAIAELRSLCDDFGDNEWGDNLHLADIIDKHLGRHLHAAQNEKGKPE